ncbi:hypothetical protein LXA43DRAFT_1095082 [Ganoderma leucocontextum]|nr:hypothetical protein LXA43DRAFT_1095082 [Ganoderma leucocontextum]
MPIVRPYTTAFPSLRVLNFNYTLCPWGVSSTPTRNLSEAIVRGKSIEEIRWHNREDQFARGSWSGTLEHFKAVTSDAYMTGLTCPITNLHLTAWGGTLEGEVSAICAIFADARPSLFRLALRPAHVDYIAALFSQRVEAFLSLPSLELRLDVTDLPFDVKSYLDGIGTALQRLPIVSLQVEIKCVSQFGPEPDPLKWPSLPECDSPRKPRSYCYIIDALSGEDMKGRLRYFLEKIPTLRRVAIAWGRCFLTTPHRVVAVDLDNIPHTVDRAGLPTDKFWEDQF